MMLLDHFPCILLERVQESVFAVVDMDSRDVFVGATPLKVLYKWSASSHLSERVTYDKQDCTISCGWKVVFVEYSSKLTGKG